MFTAVIIVISDFYLQYFVVIKFNIQLIVHFTKSLQQINIIY